MASTRIAAPMRGVAYRLGRLAQCPKPICTQHARSMSTSSPSRAALSSTTASATDHVPVKPIEEQTVLATIHQFPSLEPLRFETYPANHLYLPTRRDILHRAVVYEGDMTRSGTASTKNRHEVRGSARKVRPQKGSGKARLGDKNSPMLRGGGVAFGPRPRDFATELPKKVYDLAWRTALSYRFRKGELIIVDNAMEIESPSVQLLNDIFKHQEKLRGKGRSLLVTLEERPLLEEALNQLDRGEQTLTWEEVDVKNLLELSRVIIERDALHNILQTHQEDLTHVAVQPWHKSLIKRSPPSNLEALIGWAEFRDLQLLDSKSRRETRPVAYESVASRRYALAETLPAGPERNELNRSAYQMLADAKALEFKELTGMTFETYSQDAQEEGEGDQTRFPAVRLLKAQSEDAQTRAQEASRDSELESEKIELEILLLDIRGLKLQQAASLLAAQVYEHLVVAQKLCGDVDAADLSLNCASSERSNMEWLDETILDKELALAEGKVKVSRAQGNRAAERKAQSELDRLQGVMDRRARLVAEQESTSAELEDGRGEELLVEEPISRGIEPRK